MQSVASLWTKQMPLQSRTCSCSPGWTLQPQVRCCTGYERAETCPQGTESFEIELQRLIFSTAPPFELPQKLLVSNESVLIRNSAKEVFGGEERPMKYSQMALMSFTGLPEGKGNTTYESGLSAYGRGIWKREGVVTKSWPKPCSLAGQMLR